MAHNVQDPAARGVAWAFAAAGGGVAFVSMAEGDGDGALRVVFLGQIRTGRQYRDRVFF